MGKRTSKQAPMFVAATELPVSPGHPFYAKLNTILDGAGFDRFAEEQCQRFYAPVMGRPSLPPGRYFRLLLVGYFEGLDSERGMAWRAADSLAVRTFVGLDLDTAAPDHSTISRTRRLIDVETLYRGATGHLSARYRGGRRPTGLVGADRGSGRKC
jgi:transposase